MSDRLLLSENGRDYRAYVRVPTTCNGAGVLLIPAIYGVNDEMRASADDFARRGFCAMSPDIFWRLEPGLQLSEHVPQEREKAYSLLGRFDVDTGVRDLALAVKALRALPECVGKVGTVGYCLGGLLAYLVGVRASVDCTVSYYGVDIDKHLDEARGFDGPIMFHSGAIDPYDPPESRERVRQFFSDRTAVETHVYDGADHAFARVGGRNYHAEAAALANRRTDEFLRRHLLGAV